MALSKRRVFLSLGGHNDTGMTSMLNSCLEVGQAPNNPTHARIDQLVLTPSKQEFFPKDTAAVLICGDFVESVLIGAFHSERVLALIPRPGWNGLAPAISEPILENGFHQSLRCTIKRFTRDGRVEEATMNDLNIQYIGMMISLF